MQYKVPMSCFEATSSVSFAILSTKFLLHVPPCTFLNPFLCCIECVSLNWSFSPSWLLVFSFFRLCSINSHVFCAIQSSFFFFNPRFFITAFTVELFIVEFLFTCISYDSETILASSYLNDFMTMGSLGLLISTWVTYLSISFCLSQFHLC